MKKDFDNQLNHWIEKEKAASKLSGIVVDLWYNKSIELVLFRKKLYDKGIELILGNHALARKIIKKELTVHDTLQLAEAIAKLDIAHTKIDLGRLGSEWLDAKVKGEKDINSFVTNQLADLIGKNDHDRQGCDVVLYGFGRIGRIAARILIEKTGKGQQLLLKGIVIRGELDKAQISKRAELLKTDSTFGPFRGTVEEDIENQCLIINGQKVQLISAGKASEIDYTAYGINDAILIDNTGSSRDREGLGEHLKAKGIAKVLLTAPGKEGIPNIVYGINHDEFEIDQEEILSAASCTTNAIVPPLKIIDDFFGIEYGHIETVHSYTNDQNLLDNYHNKYRRGRAAPLNLVITETGAGKAVAKALPKLAGKLTGNAVRIPTPNGSLAILNLILKKRANKEEVNEVIKHHSLFGRLIEQVEFSENQELVSSDIIRNTHACIIDGAATIVSENRKNIILYVWYDNEWGYTEQVIRFAKYIAGVERLNYY
ncbi:MAG: glyceraldehyde-3-phosphate dehydrogenase [Bacteroidetes bacterium]|jgi:glyceraldehyde 3-phosphate dehydrogenase|nr:glyceraldehyde-3-phosphate dehydrogenase [Bacteroidota bacterium]MBT5527549.1 glyceraldehyde-3-phosphate dehydrogenase [Cytophagia bacterium]MBT3423263.1 glyceraldehyde-3-phosphate dehydrogenase [Bacteroidota bacterium]MBT3935434.1 glyceraldehyde-3-phosphate dehydrogenase [Bacteroidota bacterium]MBT5990114.1 glyceraldehyde-3-phosphate dehydrogenase [Bacteroidota bacterium]